VLLGRKEEEGREGHREALPAFFLDPRQKRAKKNLLTCKEEKEFKAVFVSPSFFSSPGSLLHMF